MIEILRKFSSFFFFYLTFLILVVLCNRVTRIVDSPQKFQIFILPEKKHISTFIFKVFLL